MDTYPTLKRSGATDILALALVQTIRAALDPDISLKTYRIARRESVALTRRCVRAAIAAGFREDLQRSVEATAFREPVKVGPRYTPDWRG